MILRKRAPVSREPRPETAPEHSGKTEDRSFGGKILVPELVPANCFGQAPRLVIGQDAWNVLRKFVYRRAEYRCEICGRQDRMAAHERYLIQNDTMTLVRLLAVCDACHMVMHYGFAQTQGKADDALRWMMKINGWSRKRCMSVVVAAFQEWNNRDHVVRVDFSTLDEDPVLSRVLAGFR